MFVSCFQCFTFSFTIFFFLYFEIHFCGILLFIWLLFTLIHSTKYPKCATQIFLYHINRTLILNFSHFIQKKLFCISSQNCESWMKNSIKFLAFPFFRTRWTEMFGTRFAFASIRTEKWTFKPTTRYDTCLFVVLSHLFSLFLTR